MPNRHFLVVALMLTLAAVPIAHAVAGGGAGGIGGFTWDPKDHVITQQPWQEWAGSIPERTGSARKDNPQTAIQLPPARPSQPSR